jgi:hypothetical protein
MVQRAASKMWMTPNVMHHHQNPTLLRKFRAWSGQRIHEFQSTFFFGFSFMKIFQICSLRLHHVCVAVTTCSNERTIE